MNEALQRYAIDPLLAAALLVFAVGVASALLLGLDRMQGRLGQVVGAGSRKLASLEGLRGVLALAVVGHHACCWYFFTQFGVWTTGRSILFDRLASFGVMQFFFLSGFLFWRKLMKTGSIPLGRFYLARFVRIAPVYYLCVGAAVLTGFAVFGFRLLVTPRELLASLAPWTLFSQGMPTPVNHASIVRITSGVTWTLGLEWLFYLSLPFLAWFACQPLKRKLGRLVVYALIFGGVFLAGRDLRSSPEAGSHIAGAVLAEYAKFMLVGFGGGILVAALEEEMRRWLSTLLPRASWIVAGCFIAYLVVPGIEPAGQLLLLLAFAFVVLGADIFGLLITRPMRLLGIISYPIYLIHGLAYFWAMRLRGGMHEVSLAAYLAETGVCIAVILLAAVVVHLLVERPTMRLSERIARAAALPQQIAP